MPNHDYRPDLMGRAEVSPDGPVEAGSWTAFTLTYTAGKFGIDDQGGVKLAFRTHSDTTPLQLEDPEAPGYLTVETSNGAPIEVDVGYKRNIRPWGICVTVLCKRFLAPGDTIVFRIGDPRRGSPGVRMQTHVESRHQFRITVDAFATVDYTPLEEHAQPAVAVVAGPPARWRAELPTLRRPGEPFRLVARAEDRWGNPSDRFDGTLALAADPPIEGLPDAVELRAGEFAAVVPGLSAAGDGDYAVTVGIDGETVARSNPLRIEADAPLVHYWSDMHGQSGETIGTGTAREYFAFAKYRSFVDIAGHQGNDFQITDAFWDEINALTAEFDEPGAFLALPGYEWSGNTGLGGDHNVWYREEGRPIYRSSRALVADTTRPESDCHDAAELFAALAGEDALVVPHVGGRYADVGHAHDASLEPSVEVHSSWGTFDWIVRDALALGHRVGIVAASDGHKGRPGASWPGDSKFGACGGLTCHLLPALTRDALFEHFRRRHHYATTGERLYLSVRMRFAGASRVFDRNPDLANARAVPAEVAIMGDIVETDAEAAELELEVSAGSPIERIELLDGLTRLATVRPFGEAELGARYRIVCAGQETRGRQRMVVWEGCARLVGARVARLAARNFHNPDRQPALVAPDEIAWSGVTTGGAQSIDLWLEAAPAPDARLVVETGRGTLDVALAEVGVDGVEVPCGGLDVSLGVARLPQRLTETRTAVRRRIRVPETGDAAVRARVTLENGHVAWSSPIYAFRAARAGSG